MRPVSAIDLLDQSVRANRGHNFVYLNNPKCGCSTIKTLLWSKIENIPQDQVPKDVHRFKKTPFERGFRRLAWAKDATIFSFVRNPFPRVVSAYLDKVRGKENRIGRGFCRRYRLDYSEDISFDKFIDIIAQDDPASLEPHWRPQHFNIVYPIIKPNFVGHLETIDVQLDPILNKIFGKPLSAPPPRMNKTGASAIYQDFLQTPQTLKKIQDLYAADFEYFRYFVDPDQGYNPIEPMEENNQGHETVTQLAAYQKLWLPNRRKAFARANFGTDIPKVF